MLSLRHLVLIGAVFTISNARPGKLPWRVDPYHDREVKHNVPEFHADNGAFFYPDQEFFDHPGFEKMTNPPRADGHGDFEDFSGWGEVGDDDVEQNRIPTLSRDPTRDHVMFGDDYGLDFGPDDVIHELLPHDGKGQGPYVVLEEEHFGNELNDFDKIQELTRRMEQMQREMQQMKNMLAKKYSLLGRRK